MGFKLQNTAILLLVVRTACFTSSCALGASAADRTLKDVALEQSITATTTPFSSAKQGRKLLDVTLSQQTAVRSLQEQEEKEGAAGEFDQDCWYESGDETPCDSGYAAYCCNSQNPASGTCEGPADNWITCSDQYGYEFSYGWCKNNIC